MNTLRIYAVLASILVATPAAAYIGPGAGIGAIGTVVAFVGAMLLMIVGFVWYPVKRLLRKRKAAKTDAAATDTDNDETESVSEA